ncbi:MAG: CbiQ family ECF transporter T component, partial [Cyanobacteria bacterium J06623_5]
MDLLRSLPIGLYMEQPVTWLHRIDARVKAAWLLSILLAPILASSPYRIAIVGFLILLTVSARIPWRVWRQQMGWLLLLGTLITALLLIMPDGIAVSQQPRLPTAQALENWPENLQPLSPLPEVQTATDYRYDLVDWQVAKLPPLNFSIRITQRSRRIAIKVSTLVFTLIYATTLFLLTTAPEEITEGLENLMQPLRWTGLPITE